MRAHPVLMHFRGFDTDSTAKTGKSSRNRAERSALAGLRDSTIDADKALIAKEIVPPCQPRKSPGMLRDLRDEETGFKNFAGRLSMRAGLLRFTSQCLFFFSFNYLKKRESKEAATAGAAEKREVAGKFNHIAGWCFLKNQ